MGGGGTPFNMLRHFAFRHPQVDLEIDGKVLEWCVKCGMMSQDVEIMRDQLYVRSYKKGERMKRRQ